MKITKQQFLHILEGVKPGIASREIIEQSDSFVFSKGRVYTFNDELTASAEVPFKFTGAVKAKELFELLNKMNDVEINVTTTDTEFRISGTKIDAGIQMDKEIKLPLDEIEQPGKWFKLPEEFEKALTLTIPAASNDFSKPAITCILLHDGKATCTDGYKLGHFIFKKTCFKKKVLIPVNPLKNILKYEMTSFSKTDNWIHFRSKDNAIVSCKTINAEYPSVFHLLDEQGKNVEFPSSMGKMIDRIKVFNSSDVQLDQLVDITMNSDKVTIQSKNVKGWAKEWRAINNPAIKQSITFQMNPDSLMAMLSKDINNVILCDRFLKFEGEQFVYMALHHTGE